MFSRMFVRIFCRLDFADKLILIKLVFCLLYKNVYLVPLSFELFIIMIVF